MKYADDIDICIALAYHTGRSFEGQNKYENPVQTEELINILNSYLYNFNASCRCLRFMLDKFSSILSHFELNFQMSFLNRFLAGVCLQQLFLNFLCTVFSKLLTRILKDAKVFYFKF